jgi:hypothetical protein
MKRVLLKDLDPVTRGDRLLVDLSTKECGVRYAAIFCWGVLFLQGSAFGASPGTPGTILIRSS